MKIQSLLIKTTHSHRTTLLEVFVDKQYLVPIERHEDYPYLLITHTEYLFCEPVKEFIKSIQT